MDQIPSDTEVGYTIDDVKLMQNNGKIDTKTGNLVFQKVSPFRRILPQVLASLVKHLLIVDLSMSISVPAIIIPQLTGVRNRAPDEFLVLNDMQASWFASLAFICQPLGSCLSGVVLEQIGRKKAMMIVNLPHIAAWLMLYFAQDLRTIFLANILLGLGVGFMEAPVLTYVGEITFCLAVYSWRALPFGLNSFEKVDLAGNAVTYTPIVLFLCLAFSTSLGITVIPWVMISEIFPNQTRGMSSGLTAACVHTMFFISTKTYYNLETSISLFGVICFYTLIAVMGTLFMYNFLPETEGKTLEEIEAHFSDNTLKLWDHKIRPTLPLLKK
uniref:CSON014626 protein n=1 Tax=Culicoides sonorensis TaxID=179676 RepID=A0A336K6S6_CULSO